MTDADIAAIRDIQNQRYDRWDWNYGFCEDGGLVRKKRIENCGTVEAHITLKNDLIAGISFHGDYFSTLSPEILGGLLTGLPLIEEALLVALEGHRAEDYITGLHNEVLVTLLCGK